VRVAEGPHDPGGVEKESDAMVSTLLLLLLLLLYYSLLLMLL
jgi:hypothetical protein